MSRWLGEEPRVKVKKEKEKEVEGARLAVATGAERKRQKGGDCYHQQCGESSIELLVISVRKGGEGEGEGEGEGKRERPHAQCNRSLFSFYLLCCSEKPRSTPFGASAHYTLLTQWALLKMWRAEEERER